MPNMNIKPPLAGMVRSTAYQDQPPFSAYDILNMWPFDPKTGRKMVATRPAITSFSGTTECNMLERINGVRSGFPIDSFAAAIWDGSSATNDLFVWDGSGLISTTGAQAGSVDRGRRVSAAPLINKLFITKESAKPIVLDYTTNTAATLVESAGTCPSDARIAVTWNGCICLAAVQATPHVLYISRGGDGTDWDATVASTDRYGAFFTDSEFNGILSGAIHALMPMNDDRMIISTEEGTLQLMGHPRRGGILEPLSPDRVLGQGAWTRTPTGRIYMLTQLGMMMMEPWQNAVPTPVSKARIPDELTGLLYTYDDPTINLQYDARWNGIWITNRGLEEQAWWFDVEGGSFSRMTLDSYPYDTLDFPDFQTESTSGVLLGRYDGIYQVDRFGTETINTAVTFGPIRLSQSPREKRKILQARITFGRDTPSTGADGTVKFACGVDGQDAISRLDAGKHQFSTTLTALKANNGVCTPMVSGGAVAISVSSNDGDIAIEEISIDTDNGTRSGVQRITQTAVEGAATTFTDGVIEFDDTIWEGYSEATPEAPEESLDDHTHYIDLSIMPASWWAKVSTTGADIRITDTSNNEKPRALFDFDYSGQTGMVAFKMTQLTTPRAVRVWVGNELALEPAGTDTNGGQNAFDSFYRVILVNGVGNATGEETDYSQYEVLSTAVDTNLSSGDVADGPLGARATDWSSASTGWNANDFIAAEGLSAITAWTFQTAARFNNDPGGLGHQLSGIDFNISNYHALYAKGISNNARARAITGENLTPATPISESPSEGAIVDNWYWFQSSHESAPNDQVLACVNDNPDPTPDTTAHVEPPSLYNLQIGRGADADLAMSFVHTTARSVGWLKYQGRMFEDNSAFWNTFGAFETVNTPPTETLNTTACPSGITTPTETGSWDGYDTWTPQSAPTSSLLRFSHIMDLSLASASWWANVVDQDDIRVTDTNDNALPFDVIEFDSSAQTGLMIVRQTQASSGAQAFRVWSGNASAISLNACSEYGRYLAYDADWVAFWPYGHGTDRCQNQLALTATGGTVVDTAAGPTGHDCAIYNSTTELKQYASVTTTALTSVPLTLHASAKRFAASNFEDSVLVEIADSSSVSAAQLHTVASSSPIRLTTRSAGGGEVSAGNNTSLSADTWFHAFALAKGGNTRQALVDGGGTTQTPQTSVTPTSLDTIRIGGTVAGGAAARLFGGRLAFVGVHSAVRSPAWHAYWESMMSQNSFWTTPTFTAGTLVL